MELKYKICKDDCYSNLKELLKNYFFISDRLLLRLKRSNNLYINGVSSSVNALLNIGDIITINLDFIEETPNIVPTNIPLDIVYEDDALLIINKPAGIAVHPSMEHFEDSLSNGIKFYFNKIDLKKKIRPVNRLDKDTSGLVVFAKNEYIQECLIKQMQNNTFIKEYIAICDGVLSETSGTINKPISRKADSIIERCIDENGDVSITHYNVTACNNNLSVVNIILETGRTHQIRVHFASIGNAVLGDTLYGCASDLISRQALHSYKVSFIHPISLEKMEIIAPLYDDMKFVINEKIVINK